MVGGLTLRCQEGISMLRTMPKDCVRGLRSGWKGCDVASG